MDVRLLYFGVILDVHAVYLQIMGAMPPAWQDYCSHHSVGGGGGRGRGI